MRIECVQLQEPAHAPGDVDLADLRDVEGRRVLRSDQGANRAVDGICNRNLANDIPACVPALAILARKIGIGIVFLPAIEAKCLLGDARVGYLAVGPALLCRDRSRQNPEAATEATRPCSKAVCEATTPTCFASLRPVVSREGEAAPGMDMQPSPTRRNHRRPFDAPMTCARQHSAAARDSAILPDHLSR